MRIIRKRKMFLWWWVTVSLFGWRKCMRKMRTNVWGQIPIYVVFIRSCYVIILNVYSVHKQLTHTTTFLGNPQLIAGQVRGHAVKMSNMALDIVDKDLTQQCFTGIQLSQPTLWTYLLEVLPTLSENFYHFAINNYNLRRIILAVCKVLLFAIPVDLVKKIGLVSQWQNGPLCLGDGLGNIGSCVRKLCFLTLIKRSNLLYPIPAKLKTVSLSGISFVCTRYSTEAQRRIYKTIAIPAIGGMINSFTSCSWRDMLWVTYTSLDR